jgi:GRF zinc finger
MSQALPTAFACSTCHRLLTLKICKSNKNGNAGRSFTACYKKHNNGTNCSFFKWADDRLSPPTSWFASSSPPSSPTLSAPPSVQPATLPLPTQLVLPSTLNTTSRLMTCAKPGRNRCKSTRLHPECKCWMCRRHCLEAGGCRAKGHGTSAVPSLTTDKGKQRVTSPSDSSQHSRSLSPSLNTAMAGALTSTDLFADPRHASQMTAVFTEHYTCEQAREEQRRAADAERIANIEKAKSHVIVYAWQKV